jgi:hypothetical protein
MKTLWLASILAVAGVGAAAAFGGCWQLFALCAGLSAALWLLSSEEAGDV